MAQGCQIWSGLITQLPEEYLNKKIKNPQRAILGNKKTTNAFTINTETPHCFFKRHFIENWCCKAPSDTPALA